MKLSNVIILVTDLERSAKFYGETLGMKETGRVPNEFVFFAAGASTLAIRKTSIKPVPGNTELSFEVPDVRATYQSLRSKVKFSQPPRAVTENATNELVATDFRDPDGHLLSITSWVPKARR